MALLDAIYDGFDDSTIDTSLWTTTSNTSDLQETGGWLQHRNSTSYIQTTAGDYTHGQVIVQATMDSVGNQQARIQFLSGSNYFVVDLEQEEIKVSRYSPGFTNLVTTNIGAGTYFVKIVVGSSATNPTLVVSTATTINGTYTSRYSGSVGGGTFNTANTIFRLQANTGDSTWRNLFGQVNEITTTTVTVPLTTSGVTAAGLVHVPVVRPVAPLGTGTASFLDPIYAGARNPVLVQQDGMGAVSAGGLVPLWVGEETPTTVTVPLATSGATAGGLVPQRVGFVPNEYELYILESVPRAYFKMGDGTTTFTDEMGNATGTYNSAPTLVTGALVNDTDQASTMTGITATSGSTQTVGYTGFAISVWFKGTSTGNLAYLTLGGSKYVEFDVVAGKLQTHFVYGSGGSNRTYDTAASVNDGVWHNLFFEYEIPEDNFGATYKTFLDGVQTDSTSFSTSANGPISRSQTGTLTVGAYTGDIDEVVLWDQSYQDRTSLALEYYNLARQLGGTRTRVTATLANDATAAGLVPVFTERPTLLVPLTEDDFRSADTLLGPDSVRPTWVSDGAVFHEGYVELPMDGSYIETVEYLIQPFEAMPGHERRPFVHILPMDFVTGRVKISAITDDNQVIYWQEIDFTDIGLITPGNYRRQWYQGYEGSGFAVDYTPSVTASSVEDYRDPNEWLSCTWYSEPDYYTGIIPDYPPVKIRIEASEGLSTDVAVIKDFNHYPVTNPTYEVLVPSLTIPSSTAGHPALYTVGELRNLIEDNLGINPDHDGPAAIFTIGYEEGAAVVVAPTGRANARGLAAGLPWTGVVPLGAATVAGLDLANAGIPLPFSVFVFSNGSATAVGLTPAFAGYAVDIYLSIPLMTVQARGLAALISIPRLLRGVTTEMEIRTQSLDIALEVMTMEGELT